MHQSITHLLRTHFMVEAYIVAGLRCLPEIHPIYKVWVERGGAACQSSLVLKKLGVFFIPPLTFFSLCVHSSLCHTSGTRYI